MAAYWTADRRRFLQSVGSVGVLGTRWSQRETPTELSSCTTLDAAGRYALTNDIGGPDGPCLDITADGVVVDGRGYGISATGGAPAVRVAADDVVVENVGELDGRPAVELAGANRCLVRGNGIGDLEDGIVLEDADENRIVGNDIDGPDFDCIVLRNANRNEVSGNSIDGEYGVRVVDSDDNRLVQNRFVETEQGIVLARSTGTTVRDNSVEAPLDVGIRVDESPETALVGNSVTGGPAAIGAERAGIAVSASPETVVRDSLARDHEGAGIRVADSDGARVVANWARLNGVGIELEAATDCELLRNVACGNERAQRRVDADSTGTVSRGNTDDCGQGRILEVVPDGSDARYRVEVSGEITPASVRGREPNPDDDIDGDSVTGRVFDGDAGDAFRVVGDVESLTVRDGDCRFFLDGAVVTPG